MPGVHRTASRSLGLPSVSCAHLVLCIHCSNMPQQRPHCGTHPPECRHPCLQRLLLLLPNKSYRTQQVHQRCHRLHIRSFPSTRQLQHLNVLLVLYHTLGAAKGHNLPQQFAAPVCHLTLQHPNEQQQQQCSHTLSECRSKALFTTAAAPLVRARSPCSSSGNCKLQRCDNEECLAALETRPYLIVRKVRKLRKLCHIFEIFCIYCN